MHRTIFILSLLFLILPAKAQPKHEVRAAWITAVYGLDWPRTRATTPQGIRKQKEELVDILDKLKAANFNTVLFQTRTRGDVLYLSSIEPQVLRISLFSKPCKYSHHFCCHKSVQAQDGYMMVHFSNTVYNGIELIFYLHHLSFLSLLLMKS